jgi:V8-like Glu-specific endopeptidase
MTSSRPMSRLELGKLESLPATETVPSKFAGLSDPTIRMTLAIGEVPRVETISRGSFEGRTLWEVKPALEDHIARPWPGQGLHVLKKPQRESVGLLSGFRPPWMDLHFRPQLSPAPRQRKNHLGRMARPLEALHLLRDNGYPWSCVGLLTNSDGATGSGSLVGSRLVLTASHCVPWESIQSGRGWSMTFAPNQRSLDPSNPLPFGQSNVSDILLYREVTGPQIDSFETGEDYAVLRLYEPLGERVGWFGNTTYSEDWNDLDVWAAVGYPAGVGPFAETAQSIVDGDAPGVFGQGSGLDLETHAQTFEGMSGGPFWAWFDIGGGNLEPRITGVISAGGGESNWLAGGSEMVHLVDNARSRWP